MIFLIVAAVAIQAADSPNNITYADAFSAAKQLIARVHTDLAFNGKRLVGCTITATSGKAAVDRYVCDATRVCVAESPRDKARQDSCLEGKFDQLAASIATEVSQKGMGE